jgi:hypothetical protein
MCLCSKPAEQQRMSCSLGRDVSRKRVARLMLSGPTLRANENTWSTRARPSAIPLEPVAMKILATRLTWKR